MELRFTNGYQYRMPVDMEFSTGGPHGEIASRVPAFVIRWSTKNRGDFSDLKRIIPLLHHAHRTNGSGFVKFLGGIAAKIPLRFPANLSPAAA
jgi:hypothetical protein